MPLVYTTHPTQRELDHELREIWAKLDNQRPGGGDGVIGADGAPGDRGPAGPQGEPGEEGPPGAAGKPQMFHRPFDFYVPPGGPGLNWQLRAIQIFPPTGGGSIPWSWTLQELGFSVLAGSSEPGALTANGYAENIKITVMGQRGFRPFYDGSSFGNPAVPTLNRLRDFNAQHNTRSSWVLWEHYWPAKSSHVERDASGRTYIGSGGNFLLDRMVGGYQPGNPWRMENASRPAEKDDWIGYPINPTDGAWANPAPWDAININISAAAGVCVNCALWGTVTVREGRVLMTACPE